MFRSLRRLGLLLPVARLEDTAYQLSIPGIGKVVAAVKKTRTAVVRVLKRTQYKEMMERQLQKIRLRHSPFSMDFHLTDMEGCDIVRRTRVTSGTLVTLVHN